MLFFQTFKISHKQKHPKKTQTPLFLESSTWSISFIKMHQVKLIHFSFPPMYPTWKKDSRVMFLGLIQWPKLNKPTSHRLGWLAPLRSTSKKTNLKRAVFVAPHFWGQNLEGGNGKKQLKWLAGQVLGIFVSIYIAPAWIVPFTKLNIDDVFFWTGKRDQCGLSQSIFCLQNIPSA